MTKLHTGERLAAIMRERGLKQVDILRLSEPYVKEFGTKLSKQDLSQYIGGKTEPNQRKLQVLASALDLSEAWLMGYDVPRERKNAVQDIDFEESLDTNVVDLALYRDRRDSVKKIVSLSRTSAGDGVMMYDDFDAEEFLFPIEEIYDTSPEVTGVIVKGKSMEPKYHEGDLLWIDSRLHADVGQIGVFSLDNESYVKKFGGDRLISLNINYPDIDLSEDDELFHIGKVVDFTPRETFEQIKNIIWT